MGTRRLIATALRALPLLLLPALAATATGCAADAEDLGEAGSAATSTRQAGADDPTPGPSDAEPRNAAYDAVARRAKITNKATPGGAFSAETTLLGYVPDAKVADVQEKLLGVRKWPDIKGDDGSRVFTASRVVSDDKGETKRTIKANVTLDGDISLDTKLVADAREGGGRKVSVANTSTYRHWLAGDVLLPGKLTIDLALIPYQGGVIVDAKARVKLEASEDSAPAITGYVVPIFNWLKAN